MRALKFFLFGLLYGWFVKIAFDRIYRDNELDDIRNENRSLREYVGTLDMRAEPGVHPSRSSQSMTPAPQPQEMNATAPEGVPVPPATLGATEERNDDLKIIKGIGPAIERKLHNAGIYTFAALAELGAEELERILGSQVKRLQDENDLIAQARELAQQG